MKKLLNRYFVKGFSGMALGLFSTLIVGLIIKQVGLLFGDSPLGVIFTGVGSIASVATGVGIGIGVAHALEAPKLVMYSSAVTGLLGAYSAKFVAGTLLTSSGVVLAGPGDPLSAFIAVIVGIEVSRLIAGKTSLDIVLTPIVTIISGCIAGIFIGPTLSAMMTNLGSFISWATELQPFAMGIIISTTMGIFLTLPISSAAISIILGLNGLAAGAATIGCVSQMVGFAVASYRENKVNGLVAQGLGTSMLQIPNIVKNPRIWVPPILTSAILGPVSTMLFKMTNNAAGGGMGTSGLVGQIMTFQTMSQTEAGLIVLAKIIVLHFILPAVLTLVFSEFMRKKQWIKQGDMQLNI